MAEVSHIRINLPDRTYQAAARSQIKALAESVGFTGHRLGEMEIIIAEITSNLWKHSDKGGYLLVKAMQDGEPYIEIISIDNGPGMRMPSKMMEDGHSTKKTLGQGLGAIRRLATVFDLYSQTGWGTILVARTYLNKSYKEEQEIFQIAALGVCKNGQIVSGDAWKVIRNGNKIRAIMIDGLGHGAHAHEAAQEAVRSFTSLPNTAPTEQIHSLHLNLKKTRGAVVNVVFIDLANQQISYSGVGNISMKVITPLQARGCFSYNGIVGHIMPAVLNNHDLQWQNSDIIILHTDGISSRWDLQKYPTILQHHPLVVCSALYKDFDRGSDDSTILMGRFIKPLNE